MNQQSQKIAQNSNKIKTEETKEVFLSGKKLGLSSVFLFLGLLLTILTIVLVSLWYSKISHQNKQLNPYLNLQEESLVYLNKGTDKFKLLLANDKGVDYEKDVVANFMKVQSLLHKVSEDDVFKQTTFIKDSILLISKIGEEQINTLVDITDDRYQNFLVQTNFDKNSKKSDVLLKSLAIEASKLKVRFEDYVNKISKILDKAQQAIDSRNKRIYAFGFQESLIFLFILLIQLVYAFWVFKLQNENKLIRKQSRTQINQQVQKLEAQTQFVEDISSGKLYSERLHNINDDKLVESLVKMQKQLQKVSKEEDIRKWVSEGINKFTDIIRSRSDNFQELGDAVLEEAIEYFEACQGALYIADSDKGNVYLDLLSCYAYKHKKFISRRVKVNLDYADGLVGQTYLEGEYIYLKEIPKDYIFLQSGLGGAVPASLLFIPLKINQKVEGILELASFNLWEQHQIDFVKRVGQNIASAIASVKSTDRTRKLLEETQEQAQALRRQEQELRQNMLDLQSAQQELAEKNGLVEEQKLSIESALVEQTEKNKKLKEQEDILIEQMEELQTTQEELNQKSQAIIQMKEQEAKNMEERAKKIESQNQMIESSINYAKSIQNAILPETDVIRQFFPEFFVFFRAKDIVSGDFYWYYQYSQTQAFIAAVDCTGHGVPGAFMSIIGNTLLNEIVSKQEEPDPAKILEELHKGVRHRLKQKESQNNDGMDVCLALVTKLENDAFELTYAGAKRSIICIQNREVKELKGDRKSIGGWQQETKRTFTNEKCKLNKGDCLYLTSDGYVDSPNPARKKFGMKRLRKMVAEIEVLPMETQKERVILALDEFQGVAEQRDDITVIGIKLS